MNIIGYKTFHWQELAKLLGFSTLTVKEQSVPILPEDFGTKGAPVHELDTAQNVAMFQNICRDGWYCIGILDDKSLDLNNRFHGKSRGEVVEKFFKSLMPVRGMWPNEEDNDAVSKGCLILNHPALPCMDFSPAGWVKVGQ